jgi:hypothetical protein
VYRYYTFINPKTLEEEQYFLNEKELEKFIKDHPGYEQTFGAPLIVSGRASSQFKTDNEFNSLLKKIKKETKSDSIKTR